MKIRFPRRKADAGAQLRSKTFSETRNTRATAFSRRPIPIHSSTAIIIMGKRICTLPGIITKPSSAMKTSRPLNRCSSSMQEKRTSHPTAKNTRSATPFPERSSAASAAAPSNAGHTTQQERVTSRGAVIPTLLIRKPAR